MSIEKPGLISIVRMFLFRRQHVGLTMVTKAMAFWLSLLLIPHGSLNSLVDYGLVPHNSSCNLLGCWLLLHAVCLMYQINDLN